MMGRWDGDGVGGGCRWGTKACCSYIGTEKLCIVCSLTGLKYKNSHIVHMYVATSQVETVADCSLTPSVSNKRLGIKNNVIILSTMPSIILYITL